MSDEPILIKDRLDPKKKAIREAARELEEKSLAMFQDLGLDMRLAMDLPLPIMLQIMIVRLLGRLELLEQYVSQHVALKTPEAPNVDNPESP